MGIGLRQRRPSELARGRFQSLMHRNVRHDLVMPLRLGEVATQSGRSCFIVLLHSPDIGCYARESSVVHSLRLYVPKRIVLLCTMLKYCDFKLHGREFRKEFQSLYSVHGADQW